uniref:Uncharacterized protein n=1 Tax=Plectus sambesii TaxID=2011161 RepID=A0A914XK37_9BILA
MWRSSMGGLELRPSVADRRLLCGRQESRSWASGVDSLSVSSAAPTRSGADDFFRNSRRLAAVQKSSARPCVIHATGLDTRNSGPSGRRPVSIIVATPSHLPAVCRLSPVRGRISNQPPTISKRCDRRVRISRPMINGPSPLYLSRAPQRRLISDGHCHRMFSNIGQRSDATLDLFTLLLLPPTAYNHHLQSRGWRTA